MYVENIPKPRLCIVVLINARLVDLVMSAGHGLPNDLPHAVTITLNTLLMHGCYYCLMVMIDNK